MHFHIGLICFRKLIMMMCLLNVCVGKLELHNVRLCNAFLNIIKRISDNYLRLASMIAHTWITVSKRQANNIRKRHIFFCEKEKTCWQKNTQILKKSTITSRYPLSICICCTSVWDGSQTEVQHIHPSIIIADYYFDYNLSYLLFFVNKQQNKMLRAAH